MNFLSGLGGGGFGGGFPGLGGLGGFPSMLMNPIQMILSLIMSLFALEGIMGGGQNAAGGYSPLQNPGFGGTGGGMPAFGMQTAANQFMGGVNDNFNAGLPAPNARAQTLIDKAKSHQGAPYVFGAAGPNKFDCSGLVYYSLNEAGVKVPRLTAEGYRRKYSDTAIKDRSQLKPGDLVFFHSANTRGIPAGQATHIEIYLGNGMTMGTDSPKEGARVEPINWNTFIGGARVPELAG